MSRLLAEKICMRGNGHDIHSMVEKEVVDPLTKLVVKHYIVICIKCGETRNKIETYRANQHTESRLQNNGPVT